LISIPYRGATNSSFSIAWWHNCFPQSVLAIRIVAGRQKTVNVTNNGDSAALGGSSNSRIHSLHPPKAARMKDKEYFILMQKKDPRPETTQFSQIRRKKHVRRTTGVQIQILDHRHFRSPFSDKLGFYARMQRILIVQIGMGDRQKLREKAPQMPAYLAKASRVFI
jgi:hypothetical protein